MTELLTEFRWPYALAYIVIAIIVGAIVRSTQQTTTDDELSMAVIFGFLWPIILVLLIVFSPVAIIDWLGKRIKK